MLQVLTFVYRSLHGNPNINVYNTIRYDTIICNAHNVCQLSESEARAVTGGTWQG